MKTERKSKSAKKPESTNEMKSPQKKKKKRRGVVFLQKLFYVL